MTRRQGTASLIASPVLVGSITVLVAIVAVFLAYNANAGLPFVPTYDLKAELPNAANLVRGNEVRVGGQRVGVVDEIVAERQDDGKVTALVSMKLEKQIEPLPSDSDLIVRPRSALGLKFIDITPGQSAAGFKPGSTVPLANATPDPVEIDEVFNTFDAPTRVGARRSLSGFGDALTGRGAGINLLIEDLPPLLADLEPVAGSLSDPQTRLAELFRALGRTAAEVAPVAEQQAQLFVNLDTTFGALATVARPFMQDTISESPATLDTLTRDLPPQRRFLQNATRLASDLKPGVAVLPDTLPDLADAVETGAEVLPKTPALNRRVASLFRELEDFSTDPLVPRGIKKLNELASDLQPTISFLTPTQTVCNYVTLWFRNVSSVLSEGDSNGTWQRFIIIAAPQGPNNEGGPSSGPADGPSRDNHLHANNYPNTAAPGQPRECEAGNEPFAAGKTVIGNTPGTQPTQTSGQKNAEGEGEASSR
ncbi:MAG: MCE family protein [Thermoleophilaceae bacterium]|nr:MCE family protein [Thermoleophilaceae bacterium]